MGISSYRSNLSRCGSPVIIYSAPEDMAQATILSSSGSFITMRGTFMSGNSDADLETAAINSSGDAAHFLRRLRNLGLFNTWYNSPMIAGVIQRVSLRSSTNFRIAFDGPNQRRPETKTLRSRTIFIMPFCVFGRDEFLLPLLLKKEKRLLWPSWQFRKALAG